MLELEKNSSKSTSVDDTSHSFTPTSNVRNGFRRKKGDSPFTYNLNLKVKKEKKQSNCTNPDPWARIVGSRNTAAIYMNGVATTALFDTGAEIQLVSKQFCEDNEWEIQPIENLTECSTVNGEIFGYEGFVEVNVQIPGRDFSEDHLFPVTFCQLGLANRIPKLIYPGDDCDNDHDPEEVDDTDEGLTYKQFEQYKTVSDQLLTESEIKSEGTQPKVVIEDIGPDMEEDIKTQNLNSDNTEKPSSEDDGSWILDFIDLSGLDDWPEHLQSEAKEMLKRNARVFS